MYQNVPAATAVGTLPFTGAEPLWLALAGFALVATGFAFKRALPSREA